MSKKSFKDNNPALAFITTQEAQQPQEVQEVQEEKRKPISQTTQGKKGKKLPRINMAFSTQNLEYLQIISRIEGISITEYVNRLVEADKESRNDIVEQAKKIFKGANK